MPVGVFKCIQGILRFWCNLLNEFFIFNLGAEMNWFCNEYLIVIQHDRKFFSFFYFIRSRYCQEKFSTLRQLTVDRW